MVLIGLIENRSKCLAAALVEEVGGQWAHLKREPPEERTD